MDESAIRRALDAERAVTLSRIEAMTADFDGIVSAVAGMNGDDEHDPEGSTVAFERAQVAALLDEARSYQGDIERAEARLAAGAYAVCEACGAGIAPDRLAARPAVRTCIGCALSLPRR
ncbi:MAG TPA: TraR/DksA C4-type zinc finger protein [Acidimicrobiales bacterium]|nr:TraR/DksA C4-type zinc finger protein [Acidimicrobiales bacterium]